MQPWEEEDAYRLWSVESRRCRALTRKGLSCPNHWLEDVDWQREQQLCHLHAVRPGQPPRKVALQPEDGPLQPSLFGGA